MYLCCCSVSKLCATLCNPMDCSMLVFPCPSVSPSLLKFMSVESVMPFNHHILCRPLLSLVFPSIKVFFIELALRIRWPKYWNFSFSISPSNEYSELISFRFDLLAVQGTLNSLLQHHNWKALILQCSAFFMVQLSHVSLSSYQLLTSLHFTKKRDP